MTAAGLGRGVQKSQQPKKSNSLSMYILWRISTTLCLIHRILICTSWIQTYTEYYSIQIRYRAQMAYIHTLIHLLFPIQYSAVGRRCKSTLNKRALLSISSSSWKKKWRKSEQKILSLFVPFYFSLLAAVFSYVVTYTCAYPDISKLSRYGEKPPHKFKPLTKFLLVICTYLNSITSYRFWFFSFFFFQAP